MTGLEKIIGEIEDVARDQANEIVSQAEKQGQDIIDSEKEKAQQHYIKIVETAKGQAVEIEQRSDSGAQLDNRQKLLGVKQDAISKTLEKAKKAIIDLPDEQYLELFSKLAKGIDLSGKGELRLNERDKERIGAQLLGSFPDSLELSLAEKPADISGGFLLVVDKVITNSSVDAIFENYYDELADAVQGELFD